MTKIDDHNTVVEHEFTSLEEVLNQTADDAARCLKLLKKNLSDYDNRHGNHFTNTATSYMRSDIRTAKDTAFDLKHAAHQINKSPQRSESDINLARNMMDAVTTTMDVLSTTARNYDQKNGRSKGVKGVIDNVIGNNDKESHEKKGGLFSRSNKRKDEKHTGIFGKSDDKNKDANHGSEMTGNSDYDHTHRVDVFDGFDTVEQLVTRTLRDNFNVSALNHQITVAEESLSSSPSLMERAKEMVHDVKEKLKGGKTSPSHGGKTSPTHDGNNHVVAP